MSLRAGQSGDPLAELQRVDVRVPQESYPVWIGPGALNLIGDILPSPPGETVAAVIGDERTTALFGSRVADALRPHGWRVLSLTAPAGEGSKSVEQACRLWQALAQAEADRRATVFALGGGVIGDLAGFVAATYMRGVPLVQLPTTLTAQVDAAVGGKTAVDLPEGKNLVGAFHQPVAVIADTDALAQLPRRELRSGCAEIVKHAAIADAALFAVLEGRAGDLLEDGAELWPEVVARNAAVKAAIVADDPRETTGARAVLNYGHTVGHALERAARDWSLSHGEAVSLGITAESRLAVQLSLSTHECSQRQERLLGQFGLPTAIAADQVEVKAACQALRRDKKRAAGALQLPFVPTIGEVQLAAGVDPGRLEEALLSVVA